VTTLETFITELYDRPGVTEQIEPAAVLSEEPGHIVVMALSAVDVRHRGVWDVSTGSWTRYDQAWISAGDPGTARAVGAVHVTYGVPSRYDITLYRVSLTAHGAELGWTVEALVDEVLRPAGLSLETVPRAALKAAPKPFRF
jgi:hypothetical protein